MKIKAQQGDIYRKVGILYHYAVNGLICLTLTILLTVSLSHGYLTIFGG